MGQQENNEPQQSGSCFDGYDHGSRIVPIIWGAVPLTVGIIVFFIFDGWIANSIALVFGWIGWKSIKLGLFASQKLIDEMTLNRTRGSIQDPALMNEWRRFHGIPEQSDPKTNSSEPKE